MDISKKILIEHSLTKAIIIFGELPDKYMSSKYARNFFDRFCSENQIDRIEAFILLKDNIKDFALQHPHFNTKEFAKLENILLTSEEANILRSRIIAETLKFKENDDIR